jgi:hypothetical protein
MCRAIRLRVALAAVLVLAVAALTAGTASADPGGARNALSVTLNCGGAPINAVAVGAGNSIFTPAFDLDGTAVFIPLQFGPQTGVFTDPTGTQHPFSNQGSPPKGSANPPNETILDCTFHATGTFPDGSSVVVDGSVTGYIVG